jgi:hypothetical protein
MLNQDQDALLSAYVKAVVYVSFILSVHTIGSLDAAIEFSGLDPDSGDKEYAEHTAGMMLVDFTTIMRMAYQFQRGKAQKYEDGKEYAESMSYIVAGILSRAIELSMHIKSAVRQMNSMFALLPLDDDASKKIHSILKQAADGAEKCLPLFEKIIQDTKKGLEEITAAVIGDPTSDDVSISFAQKLKWYIPMAAGHPFLPSTAFL